MASSAFVLLSLALLATVIGAPVEEPVAPVALDVPLTTNGTNLPNNVPIVIQIIQPAPLAPLLPVDVSTTEAATTAKDEKHSVVKRSALRGDNANNDLLADLDGQQYDAGLSSIAGRRIKFLPSWAG